MSEISESWRLRQVDLKFKHSLGSIGVKIHLLKQTWKLECSKVKSTACSYRRPRYGSQHLHGDP